MGGERLDQHPPYRRRVNTVFQSYALFPHLTVEQNVAYGLRVAKRPEAEIAAASRRSAGQSKDDGPRESEALEDQRRTAAACRAGSRAGKPAATALARRAALGAGRKSAPADAGRTEILQREVGIAFVFVTHDQEEAMVMSDRIALLRSGELEQVATRAKSTAVPRPPTSRSSSATPIC